MLTTYQTQTAAYQTENGELLCPECFEEGDHYAKPVIRYHLDEWQSFEADGYVDWDYDLEAVHEDEENGKHGLIRGVWHTEACDCQPELTDEAGHELLEAWQDPTCYDEGSQPWDEDEDEQVGELTALPYYPQRYIQDGEIWEALSPTESRRVSDEEDA